MSTIQIADCRNISATAKNVQAGYMDGCHGYDWGGSRYTTPNLEADQVIIGLQLMYNNYGLCQLGGVIVCSILKIDDPNRVISLVRTTDGYGNLIVVGNTSGTWTNTGDSFILPVGYALIGMNQSVCNKIREIWLVGKNFAKQTVTIGPISPNNASGNINGNASPPIRADGELPCITRIEWQYRGGGDDGNGGLTGIPTIYSKDFNVFSDKTIRTNTILYENTLSITKSKNALLKYTVDYFGTDLQRDDYADQFCPTANLNLPENKWCSCYLSRKTVLADPTLSKLYPLAKYTTQPQCWNDVCLMDGYKNFGIRSSPSCPSLTICTQDLASVSGANNILKNVILTQDCSTGIKGDGTPGGTTVVNNDTQSNFSMNIMGYDVQWYVLLLFVLVVFTVAVTLFKSKSDDLPNYYPYYNPNYINNLVPSK